MLDQWMSTRSSRSWFWFDSPLQYRYRFHLYCVHVYRSLTFLANIRRCSSNLLSLWQVHGFHHYVESQISYLLYLAASFRLGRLRSGRKNTFFVYGVFRSISVRTCIVKQNSRLTIISFSYSLILFFPPFNIPFVHSLAWCSPEEFSGFFYLWLEMSFFLSIGYPSFFHMDNAISSGWFCSKDDFCCTDIKQCIIYNLKLYPQFSFLYLLTHAPWVIPS